MACLIPGSQKCHDGVCVCTKKLGLEMEELLRRLCAAGSLGPTAATALCTLNYAPNREPLPIDGNKIVPLIDPLSPLGLSGRPCSGTGGGVAVSRQTGSFTPPPLSSHPTGAHSPLLPSPGLFCPTPAT